MIRRAGTNPNFWLLATFGGEFHLNFLNFVTLGSPSLYTIPLVQILKGVCQVRLDVRARRLQDLSWEFRYRTNLSKTTSCCHMSFGIVLKLPARCILDYCLLVKGSVSWHISCTCYKLFTHAACPHQLQELELKDVLGRSVSQAMFDHCCLNWLKA